MCLSQTRWHRHARLARRVLVALADKLLERRARDLEQLAMGRVAASLGKERRGVW